MSQIPWQKWGPRLSERQWGTVREDYSSRGDARSYFPHITLVPPRLPLAVTMPGIARSTISTPTHSYMKYLYKHPLVPFPYSELATSNRWRSRTESEDELIDTGIFNDDKYFDVFVEYSRKGSTGYIGSPADGATQSIIARVAGPRRT